MVYGGGSVYGGGDVYGESSGSLALIGGFRCGCPDKTCSCEFEETGSITITGTGDPGDPLGFVADAQIYLQVTDTATVDLTLTGSGIPSAPYVLSGTTGSAGTNEFVFLADTPGWTAPVDYAGTSGWVSMAGGGGGADDSLGPGDGGGYSETIIPGLGDLTLDITVGQGGGPGVDGTSSAIEDTATARVLLQAGGGGQDTELSSGGEGMWAGGDQYPFPSAHPDSTVAGATGGDLDEAGGSCVCRGFSGGASGNPGLPGDAWSGGGGATTGSGGDGGDGGFPAGGGGQADGAGIQGSGGNGYVSIVFR